MGNGFITICEEEREEEGAEISRAIVRSFALDEKTGNAAIIKLADYGIITAKAAAQLRKEGALGLELAMRLDGWGEIAVNGRNFLVERGKLKGLARDLGLLENMAGKR